MFSEFTEDYQPFIDYIDGVFYQTDTFEQLCECYAENYHNNVEPCIRQYIDEKEFIDLFKRNIISQDIRDSDEFENEASLIYNKLLCMNLC